MSVTSDNSNAPATGFICRPASYFEQLDLGAVFDVTRPVEVELGSGDGSFLVQWAAKQPEINFLGVERLLGRLRKIDRKARRAGVDNVRVLRIEAAYFLEYMLPPAGVQAVHVYFPDPWPKRKHRKNRLINPEFPRLLEKVLVRNGRIYLRTDDSDYFEQMQQSFAGAPSFRVVETPAALAATLTDFERTFHARGVATLSLALERVN